MIWSGTRRRASFAIVAATLALAALPLAHAVAQDADPAPAPNTAPAWDQVANVRGAAERIGRVHRTGGAKAAYELIENCYKTHSLAEEYGEGFEACIVQDYLETRTLMQVYSRMPPETLQKLGVPTPQVLADNMAKRVSMAFSQYKKSQAFADNVRKLTDEHGLPVFLAIVFPEAVKAHGEQKSEQKK